MCTDKLFTGQRDVGLGIYHYGARFYSPYLNRFLQPDTIVPGAFNPQSLNRFSYTLNNPLRYTDPTGHIFRDLLTPKQRIQSFLPHIYPMWLVNERLDDLFDVNFYNVVHIEHGYQLYFQYIVYRWIYT